MLLFGYQFKSDSRLDNYFRIWGTLDSTNTHVFAGFQYSVNNSAYFESYDGSATLTQSIVAVPEPETYAMLLAGLGLVGAVARRRRQAEGKAS